MMMGASLQGHAQASTSGCHNHYQMSVPSLQPRRSQTGFVSPAAAQAASPSSVLLSHSLRRRYSRCITRRITASALSSATRRGTLPIFPLNVVAFPASPCPLHIFEARYRVLFSTLLKGADDLEEGLIQDDKDFAGTRRFGMCWVSVPGIPLPAPYACS